MTDSAPTLFSTRAGAACTAAILAISTAAAQQPHTIRPPWSAGQPPLQRVDQGIADSEPLGVSFRDLQVDLRIPTGFESVYRLQTPARLGAPGGTFFMRMDGSITAVFPQSVYADSPWGQLPMIPPGTIFYIGGLPPDLQPADTPASRPRPTNFVDLSLSGQAPVESPALIATSESPASLPPPALHIRSIWSDDSYRRERIAALLARTEQQPVSKSPERQ
jgi:hypothetical protein